MLILDAALMSQPASAPLEDGVIDVLKQVSRRPIEPALDSDLVADLGFDSLQILEVIAELEDRFDISIPLNDVPATRTVGQVVAQVARLVEDRATPLMSTLRTLPEALAQECTQRCRLLLRRKRRQSAPLVCGSAAGGAGARPRVCAPPDCGAAIWSRWCCRTPRNFSPRCSAPRSPASSPRRCIRRRRPAMCHATSSSPRRSFVAPVRALSSPARALAPSFEAARAQLP